MNDSTPARNANARPPRYSRTSKEWPCVFGTDFMRDQIDPRIKDEWAASRADKPKWGDLRTTFRREHCSAVNPWGSETCPFKPEECAIAFLKAVQQSLGARNAHAYFVRVARASGSYRADQSVEMKAQKARMRTQEDEDE